MFTVDVKQQSNNNNKSLPELIWVIERGMQNFKKNLFSSNEIKSILARLDKVQEELLYYPGFGVGFGVGGGGGVSKMLKFLR